MNQRFPFLFTSILCALIGIITGWGLAKIDHNATCAEQTTHAYLSGKQAGLTEAQQNGSCVRWWTGTAAADIQAARRAFCRRH